MSRSNRIPSPRGDAFTDFRHAVSEINKYLSYYTFISSQFLLQNSSTIISNPENLTTQEFANNVFAKQFNIKLKLLQDETTNTDSFIFDSLFLNCCFAIDNYIKATYKYLQAIEKHFNDKGKKLISFPEGIKELRNSDLLVEQLIENLSINIGPSFTQEDYDTFNYFRLRRNTMAHRTVEERYKGFIETFINANGNILNKYWKSSGTVINTFNFCDSKLQFTKKDDVVAILNISRDIIAKLEKLALSKIFDSEWIEFLFSEYKKETSTHDLTIEDRFTKSFAKFAKIKLNKEFDTSLIKRILL